jgi:hypothetical protein
MKRPRSLLHLQGSPSWKSHQCDVQSDAFAAVNSEPHSLVCHFDYPGLLCTHSTPPVDCLHECIWSQLRAVTLATRAYVRPLEGFYGHPAAAVWTAPPVDSVRNAARHALLGLCMTKFSSICVGSISRSLRPAAVAGSLSTVCTVVC